MFENKLPNEEVRKEIISAIKKEYDFVEVGKIGESVSGRDIDVLSVGNTRRARLWVGAHHGLEWLTILVIFEFFYSICRDFKFSKHINGIDIKSVLKERGLVIVPCLNVDGVEIALEGFGCVEKNKLPIKIVDERFSRVWQANADGVDLNHNYDADWHKLHKMEISKGITEPRHTRYGGQYPESEPETKALADFCRKNKFESAIAFHSQGEEIYWDYGVNTPKDSKKFANIFALISGYKVGKPEGLAVGGGFKDWFIEKFRRPAFTIEIGEGENPLPLGDFPAIYNKLQKALYFCVLS